MDSYWYPNRGPAGSFGSEDAPTPKAQPKRNPAIKDPDSEWKREKRNGRKIDRAGKLVIQSSRPDLKGTGYIDPDRKPEFKSV